MSRADLSITHSPQKRFTFAHVDLPTDKWAWAIVTHYKDPQDFGMVVMAFEDDLEPPMTYIPVILLALDKQFECHHESSQAGICIGCGLDLERDSKNEPEQPTHEDVCCGCDSCG